MFENDGDNTDLASERNNRVVHKECEHDMFSLSALINGREASLPYDRRGLFLKSIGGLKNACQIILRLAIHLFYVYFHSSADAAADRR
jgi:hypothetical protein